MTDSERIADLEARLSKYEQWIQVRQNSHGDHYLYTLCGLHICTNFWAEQPRANGALFSAATDVHKYAAYIAKDFHPIPEDNVPGPAIYVENVRPGLQNIGIQIETANAAENIAVLADSQYSSSGMFAGRSNVLVLSDGAGTRYVCIGPDGITLTGITVWWITKAVGSIFTYSRKLWEQI